MALSKLVLNKTKEWIFKLDILGSHGGRGVECVYRKANKGLLLPLNFVFFVF